MACENSLFIHTSKYNCFKSDLLFQLEIIILILTVTSTRLLFKYCIVIQWIKAN